MCSDAAGSVLLEMGAVRILAAAYAPSPVEGASDGQLSVTASLADGTDIPEVARIAEDALRPSVQLVQYPKSVLQVKLTVLAAAPDPAAATNAAGLALALAGVSMFGMVTCVSVIVPPTGPVTLGGEGARVTVAAISAMRHATLVQSEGVLSTERLMDGVRRGMEGCLAVEAALRQFITG